MSDETEAAKALARTAWVDDQMRHAMRRTMTDTIKAGLAAGIGTTCSAILIGLAKYCALGALAWLGVPLRF